MLRISRVQLSAISQERLNDFVRGMVRHLQEHFSHELAAQGVLGEEAITSLVTQGVAEAERYGVTRAEDTRLYIECMALVHPDFARNGKAPRVTEVLEDSSLNGTQKMDRIHDWLIFTHLLPRDA